VDDSLNQESPSDEVAQSAFDPANFQPVLLIQLMRLYDVQLALLSAIDPDKAAALVDMHARGDTFCPAPAFIDREEEQ
jgi:hypothetical protein